jgi:hypothetical protein
LSVSDVQVKHRRQRRQIAVAIAEELATKDEFLLEGHEIRFFRSPLYESQMRFSLQRRIADQLKTPVEVSEIKAGRKLVGLHITKRDI